MSDEMIGLDGVSKVYHRADGDVRALETVSLQVAAGEFVVVRGPSGSGKSTLLLTIGGMIHPTSGTVTING
ncbi:MAG TPA: ATP-binding cassette domain-containing protein, partial [Armatimonadota bacterium]|nr:ATP-binding cassette domain-containing protein [Armatimonadota bacterium]